MTVFHITEIDFAYQDCDGRKIEPERFDRMLAFDVFVLFGNQRVLDNIEQEEQNRTPVRPFEDTVWDERLCEADFAKKLDDDEAERQMRIRLHAALQKLTPKQLLVVRKCFYEGKTQEEAAHELAISRASVQSRLNGALKKLKKYF